MSPFSYQEVAPAGGLRRFVACYWFLRAPVGAAPEPEPILPDGRMELVLNLGAPFRRFRSDGRSEIQPLAMIVGQMDHHVTIRATGGVDLVGVRFEPAGAHPLLRAPMEELANELVPLRSAAALAIDLAPGQTTAERARALDEALGPRIAEGRDGDVELENAVRCVVSLEGRLSVDELSARMGIGARQLERRFRERVGLGPKRFLRILRFQSVFRRARDDARAWAELALDCGYFDQAHFIRDFKSFTGRSPKDFFSRKTPLTDVFTRGRRTTGFYNTRA